MNSRRLSRVSSCVRRNGGGAICPARARWEKGNKQQTGGRGRVGPGGYRTRKPCIMSSGDDHDVRSSSSPETRQWASVKRRLGGCAGQDTLRRLLCPGQFRPTHIPSPAPWLDRWQNAPELRLGRPTGLVGTRHGDLGAPGATIDFFLLVCESPPRAILSLMDVECMSLLRARRGLDAGRFCSV